MSGRPQLYPWDDWLDGGRYPLARGRDFHVTARSFQLQVLNEVRRRRDAGFEVPEVRTRTTRDAAGREWVLIDGTKQPTKKGRRNWDAVFAGETRLVRGIDFDCTVESMRSAVYQAAARRKLDVVTSADHQSVTVHVQKTPAAIP